MDNPREIVLPKSGPIRWLAFVLIFLLAVCVIVVWMLPLALDDAVYLQKSLHLRKEGVVIQGTVVTREVNNDEDGIYIGKNPRLFYRLTVEYVVDGQTYTVRNQKFIRGYAVGDTIDVIYDPADPTISQVDLFEERWSDPLLALLP